MRGDDRTGKFVRSAASTLAFLLAFASAARAHDCSPEMGPGAAEIHARRAAFNEAILARHIDVIADVLAEGAVLVTGSDSNVFVGRDAQLASWRDDFANGHRAVYTRTPECIRIFSLASIALEYGLWRGEREAARENFAAGRYTAKWRRIEGTWRLEAEVFATETCAGDLCPGVPNADDGERDD